MIGCAVREKIGGEGAASSFILYINERFVFGSF